MPMACQDGRRWKWVLGTPALCPFSKVKKHWVWGEEQFTHGVFTNVKVNCVARKCPQEAETICQGSRILRSQKRPFDSYAGHPPRSPGPGRLTRAAGPPD